MITTTLKGKYSSYFILQISRVSTERLSKSPTVTQRLKPGSQAAKSVLIITALCKLYQIIFSSLEYFYWQK